jgi:hypothetical protein
VKFAIPILDRTLLIARDQSHAANAKLPNARTDVMMELTIKLKPESDEDTTVENLPPNSKHTAVPAIL